MSMMLITHDLGVVAENADAVAVMYAGRVVEYGSVHAVFDNPLHPYTQGLFDSMPRLGTSHDRLKTIQGSVPNPAALPSGCPFHPRCETTRRQAKQAGEAETVQITLGGAHTGNGDAVHQDRVMQKCQDENPGLLEVEPGHWAACWYTPGYGEGRATQPNVTYRRHASEAVA